MKDGAEDGAHRVGAEADQGCGREHGYGRNGKRPPEVDRDDAEQRRGESDRGADADVNFARDNDKRHAEPDDPGKGHLAQNIEKVRDGGEMTSEDRRRRHQRRQSGKKPAMLREQIRRDSSAARPRKPGFC
jgi:hypothetical protein